MIYLDITNIMGESGEEELPSFIRRKVTEELSNAYPDLKTDESFSTTLINAAELMGYISLDFDGLSAAIAKLLGGIDVPVDTSGFSNDLITFQNRDDVLTLLIHLGYLAYDEESKQVHIPNEEIRLEFARAIREVKRDDTIRRIRESEQLIFKRSGEG